MPFVKFLNEQAGIADIMQNRSHRVTGISELSQSILRGKSALTKGERELIAAVVSATNDCPFCYGVHAAAAAEFGLDESVIQAITENIDSSPVDIKLKPILKYVQKLTLTPYRMTQADADAVFAAGWDDEALSDAVLVCALFNMANRIVDGHGIDRKFASNLLKARGEYLANTGYQT